MENELERYKKELENELKDILAWWMKLAPDKVNDGFYGKIDHHNKIYAEAPKGSVLNSRILWAFSAAYNLTGDQNYLIVAERAFNYLIEHFIDKEFGGVYWTVDFEGRLLDTKKQVYALSFAIYGLTEFYRSSKNEEAKQKAIELYETIVKYSSDVKDGGYIEALTRDWKDVQDLRLSEKDANERKSMNTHLHLLEAFTNLYLIWKDRSLKKRIIELIRIFADYIIDPETGHLVLFFDNEWNPRSDIISYGHDIEAAWLIQEAAEVLGDEDLFICVKKRSINLAEAASKGLDGDGGLWYESNGSEHHLIKQKHSWPQAEAMVGFFNAWQLTGEKKFFERSLRSWRFVQDHIRDKDLGEWYWGVLEDHSPMIGEDKAGIWKCPYHNSRACIEIIRRITHILD